MRALEILLFLLCLTALPVEASERPLKGVALVIGESAYETLHALDNPKRDARAMDDMLDDLGFSVDRVLDGDGRKLRAAIDDFVAEAKDADVALVYYSGHGVEVGGADFLVPVDASLDTPKLAGESLVPVDDLLDQLARAVPVTIVLLDACRTDSFPPGTLIQLPGMDSPAPAGAAGLDVVRGPTPIAKAGAPADSLGMVVGFAASPGQPALDGEPGGNSPYAAALLKHFAAGGYSLGDLMTLVSEEVYLKTKARQLPWVNSSLRRVLSFGTPVEATSGDDAAIRDGRRQLLLTIAQVPAPQRAFVETVAASEGVPLDALYGMLKVLGIDARAGDDLEKQLQQGAEKLKDFMAERADAAVTDAELKRLAGLADEAQTEGALDLALKYRGQASARADNLSKTLDASQADLKASRLELGETYNAHAQAADLNFDFAKAAEMWGKAFEQVAQWDDETAVTYKWRQGNALAELAVHRNDRQAFADALEAYEVAGQVSSISALTRARISTSVADIKTEIGESAADPQTMEEAVAAYRAALDLYRDQGAPDEAWVRVEMGLTTALLYLGDREQGTASLDQALDAVTDAISLTRRENRPLQWARLQSTLGNVLRLLGDKTGDPALYERSVDAQRSAVAALDPDETPQDWATAQGNLGAALMRIGEQDQGTDTIDAAISAFEAALKVRTRDRLPAEWAAIEDNLGGAYSTRGGKTKDIGDYQKGMAAFEAARHVRTPEAAPFDWAQTTRNLGVAQKQAAQLGGDLDLLDQSIANYQAALAVFTRDASPMDWAQTQADLGIAALLRADATKSKADLKLARAAYAAAAEIYGRMGDDYARYFAGKLKDIDKRLKR